MELTLALQQIEILKKACDEKDEKIEKQKQRLQESQRDSNNTEPVLLQRIRPFFVHDVDPRNVLHLIHAYNSKVLVEVDIQEVQHITEQRGPIRGAGELLSRIARYRGWLSCIVDVLKDCKVQQEHVAAKIEDIVEKLEKDEQEKHSPELRILWEKKCRVQREMLQASKEKLQKEREKKEAEVKKLTDEIDQRNARINKADQDIEKLQKEREKQETQVKKLTDEISQKNARINKADQDIEKLQKEKEKQEAQVKKLTDEISQKNARINKADQDIENVKVAMENMNQQHERETKNTNEKHKRETQELVTRIQHLEGRLAATERVIYILLAGKTGNGKSATGNSILFKKVFKASCNSTSPESFSSGSSVFENTLVKVVEGPGLGDTRYRDKTYTDALLFMEKAFQANPEGFHVLLFVVQFGSRFTEEDLDSVKCLKIMFEPSFCRDYGILVVTCGDGFDFEAAVTGYTFEQWCDEQDSCFSELISEFEGRVIIFNNTTKDETKRHQQVRQLLDMAGRLGNKGTRFTASDMKISSSGMKK